LPTSSIVRRLLLATQGWMLCAAPILGALTLLNAITPWRLLLLTFALGLGAAMNAPAWQAIIPELVHEGDLKPAVTLNGIGYNVARAVGPALGGAVVAAFGSAAVFLLNACSFLGVMLVLYRWRRPASPSGLRAEDVFATARAQNFVPAMGAVRTLRLRDGAYRWGLYNDPATPCRFVETFVVESSAEHLRQHGRVTVADRDVEEVARAFHVGSSPQVISHLIYARPSATET
jgi:MFS family permease